MNRFAVQKLQRPSYNDERRINQRRTPQPLELTEFYVAPEETLALKCKKLGIMIFLLFILILLTSGPKTKDDVPKIDPKIEAQADIKKAD